MRKSFTLIEMTIVISIIAILGTIIVPNAFKMIEKAKLAAAANEFKAIAAAASAYFADTTVYPPCDDDWFGLHDPAVCVGYTCRGLDFFRNQADVVGWSGPYMDKWPSPPWVGSEGNRPEF
ncbi:MAG: type II secretion system GspH family protein, partial [Candidatus Omnitrophica bacterium]|nr:type II secretion system GspH family protein [Candidatus Omnitrophota bacterium]